MPLLKRRTLAKTQVDEFLRDDEEVFHCVMTNEIFKDYEEFAERTILCNSMVWTCSLTGKSNLTYEEALRSEQAARKVLKKFPIDLRVPTLYVANLTARSSFTCIADEVFVYMRARFFIGEVVEACVNTAWREVRVQNVIRPNDDEERATDAAKMYLEYKYEVENLQPPGKSLLSTRRIFAFKEMRRKRNIFTKNNCKLFLKQHLTREGSGALAIKQATLDAFGIASIKFEQIFVGAPPTFDRKVKHVTAKAPKHDKISKYLSKAAQENASNEKQVNRDKQKAKNEEIALILRDWNNTTEDLLLSDHKVLPRSSPIKSKIPDKYMGDVLCVMEFASCFANALGTRQYFNGGLTLSVMERILFDSRVAGPMNDCIQMFLTAIFRLQRNERQEYKAGGEAKPLISNDTIMSDRCRKWLTKNLGNHLSDLPLFTLTSSEILRLHLLASGENVTDSGLKWRAQYRGGYTSEEDPAIEFRLNNAHIIQALSVHHMCQLSIGDKLKILHCLLNQMLTYKELRESIKDMQDDVANAKSDMKAAQIMHRKRVAEHTTQIAQLKRASVGVKVELNRRRIDVLKAEAEKCTKEHDDQMNEFGCKLYHRVNMLGQDRAGRSYIKLYSLPGLLIHTDEQNAGMCISDFIPHVPELVDAERSKVKEYLLKVAEEMNSSDKENEPKMNGVEAKPPPPSREELLMCSTDPKQCPVHSTTMNAAPRWAFCENQSMLNELIAKLNKRGIRENELRNVLETDYQSISKLIMRTPNYVAITASIIQTRYNSDNLGFAEQLNVNETLRKAVVDQILDMEEKLFNGYLGGIQKDRQEFLDLINANEYLRIEELERPRQRMPEEDVSDKDWRDPAWYLNSLKTDIEKSDDDDNDDLTHSTTVERETIKFLAFALLQIAMSVKPNFLLRPLGDSKERGKIMNRHNVIDVWEKSLRNATSYAQLVLHHSVLDKCIMWSKSTLVVKCKTCQKDYNDQQILLCDYCNDGYHLYCLRPKLSAVPKGEWYCINCVEIVEKMKVKQLQEEPTSDSDTEKHVCKVCGYLEDDDSLVCSTCKGIFHIDCVHLKRSVRGVWTCTECKDGKEDGRTTNGESQYRRSGRNNEIKDALPLNNAALQELLRDVMKHEDGWPFVRPVPKYEVPDYYDIITKPMDFGTIKYKLNMGDYQFDDEVIADCQLVFENCHIYNSSEDEVYKCGSRLFQYFTKRCHELKIEHPYNSRNKRQAANDEDDECRPSKRRRMIDAK